MRDVVFDAILFLSLMLFIRMRQFFARVTVSNYPTAGYADAQENVLSVFYTFGGGIALLIYLFVPDLLSFAQLPYGIEQPLQYLGVLLTILGNLICYISHRTIGGNWMPGIEKFEGQNVVDFGIYGVIRHPLYLAHLVLGLSYFMLSANLVIAAFLVAVGALFLLGRIPKEEGFMVKHFTEYAQYVQETKYRLLPKVY